MAKYEVEIPEGMVLWVACGRNDDGSWWPRAVPILAKDREEARRKSIEDDIADREGDFEDEDEKEGYRQSLEEDAGYGWEVCELWIGKPQIDLG